MRRRVGRALGLILLLLAVLLAAGGGWFRWRLAASRPRLAGTIAAPGLTAPVTIDRDAQGVPTITGRTRADVAYATGYLHAQERFFQMDGLRRVAAGELGPLVGKAGLPLDAQARPHRFRIRARMLLAHMPAAERAMIDAYTRGVNRGLADLGAAPFEYALLRSRPEPWRAEDSLLVVYAMYLDLEGATPERELDRARAAARVGRAMADLLYPDGTELDAAIDGSRLAETPLPVALGQAPAAGARSLPAEPPPKGSNDWAVAGRFTANGAALVSNDMHLGTRIPNTWYRARLVVRADRRAAPSLDIVGVTLPGIFPIVVGSNRHVAWGFTDSFVDLHDAVTIDPVPGRADWYRTPGGARRIATVADRLCAHARCGPFPIRETIWGPIVGRLPDGREVADRWIAHDPDAIALGPMLALERAGTVGEAIAAAHRAALPDENFVVGDSAGHIGWTVIGRVPRRFGMSGADAASWADGRRGWAGDLAPDEVPAIVDPPTGRLWTANNRVVGGAALARLGNGGYDDGARAREIARRLFARDRFAPADMLAIQLDTIAIRARFWQAELLRALARHGGDPKLAAMAAPVRAWRGTADADSIGYRLIRTFRVHIISNAYAAYLGRPGDPTAPNYGAPSAEGALRRLLRARSPALVPPGYASWDGFVDAGLRDLARAVADEAGDRLAAFTWGAWMHADIHHPLASAIPLLGRLTDPPDRAMPGDSGVPRAQYRGGGASERLDVSPGHEAEGIFEMPGGQAGNPLSPYYLAGHEDWIAGHPTPLLPGPTKWRLVLRP